MNTPTEAQLNDPKWWDDRAGTATHYCTDIGQFLDYNRHYALSGKSCCVPRPTTPPAPEWGGEGLPPVGCQCERFIGNDVYRVTVVAHFDGEVVVHQEDAAPEYTGVDPGYLRPIRTQEQRDREELISAAIKACPFPGSRYTRIDVEALYDAGMLRKAGDQ